MTRVSSGTPVEGTSRGGAPGTAHGSAPAPLLRRILLQGQYETITMLRNGEQLILAIVLPLLAMVGLTVTPLLDGLGSSRINVAVPGILALCAMSTAFTGQGIATGFDRRYGVLRFLSTTPLGRTGLIAGKILAVLAVLFLQVLVVTAVALMLGWQPNPAGWLPGMAILVLGRRRLHRAGAAGRRDGPAGGDPGHHQPALDPARRAGRDRHPGRTAPCTGAGCGALPPLRRAGPGAAGCFPVRQRQRWCRTCPAALDGDRRRRSNPLVQVELRKL